MGVTKAENGFYLFLSVDLINSTLYKTKDPDWSELFINIYNHTIKIITTVWSRAKVWKILGDELLFYAKITNEQQLVDALESTTTITKELSDYLNKNSPKDIPIKLAFKTTLWSGLVASSLGKDSSKWKYLNLVVGDFVPTNRSLDFIGPDIDTGFRIAKSAFRNVILIDAKLALIFHIVIPQFNLNAKIVYFDQFKGVWDNQHYPIVWYTKDWTRLIEGFDYEDKFKNKVIMWIEDDNNTKLRNVAELLKIFNQLHKTDEINDIFKILKIKSRI